MLRERFPPAARVTGSHATGQRPRYRGRQVLGRMYSADGARPNRGDWHGRELARLRVLGKDPTASLPDPYRPARAIREASAQHDPDRTLAVRAGDRLEQPVGGRPVSQLRAIDDLHPRVGGDDDVPVGRPNVHRSTAQHFTGLSEAYGQPRARPKYVRQVRDSAQMLGDDHGGRKIPWQPRQQSASRQQSAGREGDSDHMRGRLGGGGRGGSGGGGILASSHAAWFDA